jgi:hypothetical protein
MTPETANLAHFALYDESGRIMSTGDYLPGPEDAPLAPLAHLGPRVVTAEQPIDATAQYVDAAGDLQAFPARPSPYHRWDWPTHTWIEDLEEAREHRANGIRAACQETILSGFASAALGEPHHYPAKGTDQQNLSASVLASLLPGLPADWSTPFWCADVAGDWQFRPHTAAQIQQAGIDAKHAILAAMTRNEELQAALAAAQSVAEIEEIMW